MLSSRETLLSRLNFAFIITTPSFLVRLETPDDAIQGEEHEDRGMISYDRSRKVFVLRQFHVEGFVNQYAAAVPRDGVLRFNSESIENIPAGYRARETHTIQGKDEFVERFEMANPGGGFEVYSETRFKRKAQ